MNLNPIHILSLARGFGKISFYFRLLSYWFALILIYLHHDQNDQPLDTFDIFTLAFFGLVPFVLLYEYVLKGNDKRVALLHVTVYDFISLGWLLGIMHLSMFPCAVYFMGCTSNYIAVRGFTNLYRFLLIPIAAIVVILIDGIYVDFEASFMVKILSIGYGIVHIFSLAFVSYNYAKLLHQKNKQIAEQKEEIVMQSEELLVLNESLKKANQGLEEKVYERTQELEDKNRKLADYAFINAHKLRAPVATIMGLLHLLEHNDVKNKREVILKLKETIALLEDTVSDIRKTLEAEKIL